MTSTEAIEKTISSYLQSTLCFSLENKILKKGKLILFCVKDFYCTFTLLCQEKNNKKIIFEIPYPFDFTHIDSKIIFDYTLKSFTSNNSAVEHILNKVVSKKPSKFLNKKIIVYPI